MPTQQKQLTGQFQGKVKGFLLFLILWHACEQAWKYKMLCSCRSPSSRVRKTHLFLNQKFSWHNICTDFFPPSCPLGDRKEKLLKWEHRAVEGAKRVWNPKLGVDSRSVLLSFFLLVFVRRLAGGVAVLPLVQLFDPLLSPPMLHRHWTKEFSAKAQDDQLVTNVLLHLFVSPKNLCPLKNYLHFQVCFSTSSQHLEKPFAHSDRLASSLGVFGVCFAFEEQLWKTGAI